jgi:tRNA threonylcarbamoyladenosine biosynthesis protein TsaE
METEPCLTDTERCSASPEETEALGEELARNLKPGSVIALCGGLGAGKTTLVKGIARRLGVTDCITSPTYTIICEYPARLDGKPLPLYHIDAYRLNGDEDFENTGAGEFMGRGITVIEWSERIPRSIPPGAITVDIEIAENGNRIFRLEGPNV